MPGVKEFENNNFVADGYVTRQDRTNLFQDVPYHTLLTDSVHAAHTYFNTVVRANLTLRSSTQQPAQ
jgi:hypothetical protein